MILFYKKAGKYGGFTNFSNHPVLWMGKEYPTSEHAFQAMKFYPHREDLVEVVRNLPNPWSAARFGRDKANPLREDWDKEVKKEHLVDDGRGPGYAIEKVKDQVMYDIVYNKVMLHGEIRAVLLETEEAIVEDSPIDYYWGWGEDHSGINRLGKIFMAIRNEINAIEWLPG